MIQVKALFDFPGVEDGDLPFVEGDVILTNEADYTEDGWLDGELNGKTGSFPANYVQKV